MSQNPLSQYFRQPKIYVTLPSMGAYNPPDTLSAGFENIPVYGMTGMDEIIVKTPDALFSGESNIAVIESCCPSIKNARNLSSLDINVLFAAIRIATFGDTLSASHTCPECGTESHYNIDLVKIIDFYRDKRYNGRKVLGKLVIKTQPLLFHQLLSLGVSNFELQQKLSHVQSIENEEEKQRHINQIWREFGVAQNRFYIMSIESIQTPDELVTERGFIEEWVSNCDSDTIEALKQHLSAMKEDWEIPGFDVVCTNQECKKESKLKLDLNYSSFFSRA